MELYYTEYFLHGKAKTITKIYNELKRACKSRISPDFTVFKDATVRNTVIIDDVRILEDADKEQLKDGEVLENLSLYFVTISCGGGDLFTWHLLAEEMKIPTFLFRCNGINCDNSHTNDEQQEFFYGSDFEDEKDYIYINVDECAYFPENNDGKSLDDFIHDLINCGTLRYSIETFAPEQP